MKTPIVKYSDKFLNKISILMNIGGITLWPFIVLREYYQGTTNYWRSKRERIINHESIHIKQQEELLIIPFYVLYILEWFIKLFFYGKKAYYNISFEREAYNNERDLEYLNNRKKYNWIKLIFRK
jgi:beta-lactamase regulating signal transducer with metallopeptidase domain|tara:strand:- start:383 stop:757 length:375 start_codon:yes stop_codon:yes gene_type:complete